MPGLSQLIQFNKDIISLGDEIQLRAQRGEKPVRVPVPKVPDVDDSEEFVMGMPEKEAIIEDTSVDEDLSDLQSLTGGTSGNSDNKQEKEDDNAAPSFEAPDLSALLAPMPATDAFGESSDVPDLSMFMEPEQTEEVEPEPEETSIADLDLEALLGGAGFDGSSAPTAEETTSSATVNDDDLEFYSGGFGDDNYIPQKKTAHPQPVPDFDDFSDLDSLETLDSDISNDIPADIFADLAASEAKEKGEALSLDELGLDDQTQDSQTDSTVLNTDLTDDISDLDASALEEPETLPQDTFETIDFDPETLDSSLSDTETQGDGMDFTSDVVPEDISSEETFDIPDTLEPSVEDLSIDDSSDASSDASLNDLSVGDLGDLSLEDASNSSIEDLGSFDASSFEIPDTSLDSTVDTDFATNTNIDNSLEDFSDISEITEEIPEMSAEAETSDISDFSDMPDLSELSESPDLSPELTEGFGSDFEVADGLDGLDDISDINSFDSDRDSPADSVDSITADPFAGDFGSFDEPSDGNLESEDSFGTEDISSSLPNFNLDDMDTSLDSSFDSDLDNTDSSTGFENDFTQDIPDASGDFSDMDFGDSDESTDSASFETSDTPLETFDAPELEGMDFGIPDTDSQLGPDASSGNMDFDDGEFHIPGFSDVETAKDEKRGPAIVKNNGKAAVEQLPPNTLSDEQYKKFLKNLSEYPLNVRLAFEDLIVKNEFTDDAEFEIVEKILNKAPARQVASHLEKMLDISIPVPRNFEQRTAEEYEAYKKSLSYQLRNKIIPAIFACMVLLIVGFGLFKFTKNCIYVPAMANHLYKQGYVMLQSDEYPQSEIKFNEAVNYRINKKWFFKYARGYREKKQYIRAEKMYQNILDCFKHDKTAGLEYARMELDDLANYEKAEEICRRQVLDFHINDAEGIMLLGDIFLEWGTEKEPEKLEEAREQYATLIQLYSSNMLYQSRMMRYFIRTDNLPEVLTLKTFFLPKEKNLSAEDWTELSGYLLDKSYGNLAPSEEYLRRYIEDVRLLLTRAYKMNPDDPISAYNLSRYFIYTNETSAAKKMLDNTLKNFNNASLLRRRDLYKYIDTYRLAGEEYAKVQENLRAQEYFTDGITLYIAERDASGLAGNKKIGQLFADQGDMDYFITGDYDNALMNYISSVELENDSPSIRYKIGYIQYKKKNYNEALGSFMKAGSGNVKETNLMLAMGNTLSLRGDNYAAQGYYENLIDHLDKTLAEIGITFPQTKPEHNNLITTYLRAANNYGVTLYHLASRTGNSSFNAKAIVQFSQSVRAWSALTRDQETMKRLGGSNLAEENIKYITHPVPDFEPAIYTEIQPTIVDNEKISY